MDWPPDLEREPACGEIPRATRCDARPAYAPRGRFVFGGVGRACERGKRSKCELEQHDGVDMSYSISWKSICGLGLLLFAGALHGCAIHYYDPDTEAEHIWGIGHMVMKASAPKEGHRALVRGTDVAGVTLGSSNEGGYFVVGWEKRQRIEIIDSNTAVRLEWPKGDLFNVRVGSEGPYSIGEAKPKSGGVSNEP